MINEEAPPHLKCNRWQFDNALKSQSHKDITYLSPESIALVFGDKSLDGAFERLFRGHHATALGAAPSALNTVVGEVKELAKETL